MNDHNFNVNVAIDFDVPTAIILEKISELLFESFKSDENFHLNRYWICKSSSSFSKELPYFTEKQIRTILDKCIKNDLLESNNFNKTLYDRTLSYTFTDKTYNYYFKLKSQIHNKEV